MTLLIFDCDGVLVDSEVIAHQTLLDALAALGLTISLQEAMRFPPAAASRHARRHRAADRAAAARGLSAASRDLLFARFRAELKPVADVADAIRALPYRRCAASSSSPDRLSLALEVTGSRRSSAHCSARRSHTRQARAGPVPVCRQADGSAAARLHRGRGFTAWVEAGRTPHAGDRLRAAQAMRRNLPAGCRPQARLGDPAMRDLPRCVEALKCVSDRTGGRMFV